MLDAPWNGAAFAPPTPIDIATIESAILARLSSKIGTIEISHYPDASESYRMTHRIGAALVMYKGAVYGKHLATAAIVQERELEFEITVMMRDLGWNYGGEASGTTPGAYAILESIRAALAGFRIPGCRKLRPTRERFVERDKQGGIWIYAIVFALSTIAIEQRDPDAFPIFVKGIAMEEGGETSITVGASAYTFDSSGEVHLSHANVFGVSVIGPNQLPLRPGTDFSIDAVNGIIAALAGGAVTPGETVQISYSYCDAVIAQAGQNTPSN
ncbi:MAG TPA: Gp37 family protein [Candidatus Binataceae bacterium]